MLEFKRKESFFIGSFSAMASPCEVLVDSANESLAYELCTLVAKEAGRIEQKFSRYRDDNLVHQINNSDGKKIEVDEEFARLLDFSDQCYHLSEGLFDITSGVLRKIWRFDGSGNVPSRKQAKTLLPLIGWDKVEWKKPFFSLPKGMQIDLGGIGKEYAVDSAAKLISEKSSLPVLINFGGDLFATAAPSSSKQWSVGIEAIGGSNTNALVKLKRGALATSGDERRFLEKDGIRYPHVLNPKTAWPVRHAPRSVTVAASTCIEAGFLSTMAMLKGKHARSFLEAQDVLFWIQGDA